MTLYEITRLLVARGCEEHPRLRHEHSDFCAWSLPYPIATIADPESARCGVSINDATDLWTAHALRHLDPDLYAKVVARIVELATMRA